MAEVSNAPQVPLHQEHILTGQGVLLESSVFDISYFYVITCPLFLITDVEIL